MLTQEFLNMEFGFKIWNLYLNIEIIFKYGNCL